MTQQQDDVMVIGRVVGAFGLRGEAKVELLTDFPDRFNGLATVLVGRDRRPMAIEGVRPRRGGLLLLLRGVQSPEAVTALLGSELAVPRSEAVALGDGEYFLDDLLGCEVVAEDGTALGAVAHVLRTGSNDVLVLGSGRSERLIPVIKDAIEQLDLDTRRIRVRNWVLDSGE